MKRIFILGVLLLTTSVAIASGQMHKKRGNTEKRGGTVAEVLKRLDQQLFDQTARNDTTLFKQIATEDYTRTGPDGNIGTRDQTLAMAGRLKFDSINLDDVSVRVYRDAAVLTGRATLKGQLDGQDISGPYRYIRVFVKQQGQWRVAALQITAIRAQ